MINLSSLKKLLLRQRRCSANENCIRYNYKTCQVAIGANKFEIKKAVQDIFKVDVVNISTMNVRGKLKRQGRSQGMTPAWKKAIVTLKEGQNIEVFEGL